MREAQSREAIAVTPIPKLDHSASSGGSEPYPTPLARIPRVDESECVGCNLCYLVCPVPGCITMEQIDLGLPSESWEQRTRSAPNPPVTGRNCD
jgi:dihydropyrimidine dehydrogenase (NAD+) subunit PreA